MVLQGHVGELSSINVTYNERVQIRHKAIVRILTIQYDMAQTVELIIIKNWTNLSIYI